MPRVALIAECSRRVGSGHAIETLQLTRFLKGTRWQAFIGPDVPAEILRRFGGSARRLPDLSAGTLERLARKLKDQGVGAAFLNCIRASEAQVSALRAENLAVVCLTLSGPKPLGARHFRGHNEIILAPEYAKLARTKRRHAGPVKNLLILMGGTDVKGTSAALVKELAGLRPRVHVIVGPNFAQPRALAKALKAARGTRFIVHRDPPRLPALMRRCDAAFTLGSDTALELACAGTPMALWHEAPHELAQARAMADAGCGLLMDAAPNVSGAKAAIARLDDPKLRNLLATAGRRFVDGQAGPRIAGTLRRLAQ